MKIAIKTDALHVVECAQLATQLSTPLILENSGQFDFMLFYDNDKLSLQNNNQKQFKPIYVDFLAGKLKHRYGYGGGLGQLIAKACGVKSNFKPTILDLTAGLGQDAFVLASLGCEVTMLERSPIIAALLQDGLQRARQEVWFAELKLNLVVMDAKTYLENINEIFPDVIYYDPMFPETKKSALVKKEMRIIRDLVGDDSDAEEILNLAIKKAKKRVVVKRPRLSHTISKQAPTQMYSGKSGRFDMYVTQI